MLRKMSRADSEGGIKLDSLIHLPAPLSSIMNTSYSRANEGVNPHKGLTLLNHSLKVYSNCICAKYILYIYKNNIIIFMTLF